MNVMLASRRVLVTGAGQGIGRAAAIELARAGASVIAVDRDPELLALLQAECGVLHTLVLDVTDRVAVAAAASATGRLEGLVNCVGIVHHGTILDCPEEHWDRLLEVNLTSMYRMIRAFLPGMIAGGGGSIVNVASVVSSLIAAPNRCAYAATKAGVIGLTKSVAADFVSQGIRCNAICPGTVDSPSLRERMAATGDFTKAHAEFVSRQAMKRLGTPAEIAQLILYLVSNDSAFMTGSAVVIDGGMSNQ